MASQDWIEKDFYATLGVAKDADAATIKKAYRKLARTLHPDQNAGYAKADERFKDVGDAYAVLSDPEQRQQYDQIRAMTIHIKRRGQGGDGEQVTAGVFDLVNQLTSKRDLLRKFIFFFKPFCTEGFGIAFIR